MQSHDSIDVLCLTGWQQKTEALAGIAPDGLHFDYAAYDNVEKMFSALPPNPRVAVGWSLGGQLLVRAIAGGYIRPGTLVLLGTPFQFIADKKFLEGATEAEFRDIRNNYINNTKQMLAQFQPFIGYGDAHQEDVIRKVGKAQIWKNGLFWLDELGRVNAEELNFRCFPETIIIHGENDKVIRAGSAQKFAEALPGSHLMLLPGCAHAPHLHDPENIKKIVNDCV